MTSLTFENVFKEYSLGDPVIKGMNLDVYEGELLTLLGPSGCGKTTTLRLIAGLIQPTSGNIRFSGHSILSTPPEKRATSMVFQTHAVFPFMSVAENVAFGLKMHKINRREIGQRVSKALQDVQLSGFEQRQPWQLSGGQQQRVALARALVVNPRVLLLDEPLSNLEPSLREELREGIRKLQQDSGITTIFVTHDQAEAIEISDRIALMVDGGIKQIGIPRNFYENPIDVDVARFFGSTNIYSGSKQGQQVHSKIGNLEIVSSAIPDGDVSISIRPEAITIGANGHNNLPARLVSSQFKGNNAICQFQVNGKLLSVAAKPYHKYQVGDMLILHLPKERISILTNGKEES
jgi:ABC-type Fe3+/spermidine/putrescine transport system ATPase subunit